MFKNTQVDAGDDQTLEVQGMEAAVRVVRGAVTIPAKVRRQLGLEEGTLIGLEVQQSSIILRRARIIPVEETLGSGRKTLSARGRAAGTNSV